MASRFAPYLTFDGNCTEAFTFYHSVLGGEVNLVSPTDMPEMGGPEAFGDEWEGRLIHAALMIGDTLLMASDDNPSSTYAPMQGFSVNYSVDTPEEAERIFAALAEGGEITMAIGPVPWSPLFGMLVDRFGTPWMIDCEPPPDGDA